MKRALKLLSFFVIGAPVGFTCGLAAYRAAVALGWW